MVAAVTKMIGPKSKFYEPSAGAENYPVKTSIVLQYSPLKIHETKYTHYGYIKSYSKC